MNPVTKAFIQLHLSILLAGWTGVFGKLISLSPGLIVFWRIVIAGGLIWLWAAATKKLDAVKKLDRIGIMGVGALLMLQWTLFYASIKASNVSIGVVAFSSIGFFTAILEPLFHRRRPSFKELGISLLTILGIYLIFHFDTQYRLGIVFGLLSAFGAALLAIFFKHYRAKYSTNTCMAWQLAGGFVAQQKRRVVTPERFGAHEDGVAGGGGDLQLVLPEGLDILYLLIFATFCTLGMYILQIQSLERISAFTVNLSYNLEPVYSILLAMVIFHEARDLGLSFYAGVGLIILSVMLQTLSVTKLSRRHRNLVKRQNAKEESR